MDSNEKEIYKDVESFLNGIRKNPTRSANTSQAVRGTIQESTSGYREDDIGTRQQTPIDIGRIESNGSSEESRDGSSEQAPRDYREPTRSDSRDYQRNTNDRRISTESHQSSFLSSIRQVVEPFQKSYEARSKQANQAQVSKAKKKDEESRRLTDAEAVKLRPKLITSILWQTEHLDQFIIATTKGHDETIEIWSTIDEDEAEILADFMIYRAKVNASHAKVVRQIVELMDRVKIAAIVLPRTYRTMMTYFTKGISLT